MVVFDDLVPQLASLQHGLEVGVSVRLCRRRSHRRHPAGSAPEALDPRNLVTGCLLLLVLLDESVKRDLVLQAALIRSLVRTLLL